jgi:transposase InsO family protein
MTTENTVMKAWCSAREQRNLTDDFIFHSDRGVQYASNKMTSLFSFNRKAKQSMSRKGNCWDNSPVERFFSSLKREWIGDWYYATREHAIADIREYVMVYYNTKRLHSTLNYKTPMEFENENALSSVSNNS